MKNINTVGELFFGLQSRYVIAFLGLVFFFSKCSRESERNDLGPSPEKTPGEELATFDISPDLTIQLVASEPMVQDPVVITFDPDGRLWVVEMRGFMQDIDGKGQNDRVGRVSVLEDIDGDGRMDHSKIYMDSLIMPRALALVPGGALVVENYSLWLTQDLDGDLHADTKTLLDSAYAGSTSPEHSGNGLWRNIDNWYYNAKSRFRYHLKDGKWLRDSTEFRGQWGICHDDEGRLYYNYNWSQLHADLVPPNYLSRNRNHTPTTGIDHGLTIDRRIYPIRPNPAVNRGYIPGTLDREGRLLEFTAACSPLYYRGIALPAAYYGNVFVCEPSGNLIKRNVVEKKGLLLAAHDPSPGKEFLASTDERFRPVFLATGPDGALYIADMYRGLVQYGQYVTPYLREQTLRRKLDKPINRGRIWKVTPVHWTPSGEKKLSNVPNHELITTLSHPNGWSRDIAQRLLVERGDKSVRDELEELALKGDNTLGRFHALWTLEGLELLNPDLLFKLLDDPSALISATAVRLLEPIALSDKNVRIRLGQRLSSLWEAAPIEQVLQISLTAHVLDARVSHPILAGIVSRYDTSALIRDAVMSSLQDQEFTFLKSIWNAPAWQVSKPSREIFLEMLTASIVQARDPDVLASLLSLLATNKSSFGWKEKTVLTGISIQAKNNMKPIRLASVPKIVTTLDEQDERWHFIASLFEWPGHVVDTSAAAKRTSLNEHELKQFVAGRQLYLTTCANCHGSDGKGLSRFAPPLSGSEWVLGDEKRLALILLHGLEGPVDVNGKHYDEPDILPVMPSHSTLEDGSISDILTYIRNEWGNNGGAVSPRTVGITRVTSQGRVMPWTAAELNKHVEDTKITESE
ncbi:MAG TPA: c-type cytochrome [Cyclobacteriaceae bacterium]|nr:c-type cytochrome [Cyclobacteriaceae bacterium]